MLRAMQIVLRGKSRAGAAALMPGFVNHCDYSTASNSQRLAGKVAVITGATSGIGNVTAVEFVRNGAKVGRAVKAELGVDTACYTRCDVTDEAQVSAGRSTSPSRATATWTSCSTTPASWAPWSGPLSVRSTSPTSTPSWRSTPGA